MALLVGDPSKAKQLLGWEPQTKFRDLVRLMVDADLLEDLNQNLIQRIEGANQRIEDTNQRIEDLRADMNQRSEDLRADMNQRFADLNFWLQMTFGTIFATFRQLSQRRLGIPLFSFYTGEKISGDVVPVL